MSSSRENIVFVYGSLRKGFGNHPLLERSKYLGEHFTEDEYTMYSMGAFPVVAEGGGSHIFGEVYEVDDNVFSALDRLEGYPDFYNRKQIRTEWGLAWMYYHVEAPAHLPVVESGNWADFKEAV